METIFYMASLMLAVGALVGIFAKRPGERRAAASLIVIGGFVLVVSGTILALGGK